MNDDSTARPALRLLFAWPGLALAFLWGLAEGSLFFIVPDIVITLTALFSVRASIRQVCAVTVGSIIAGVALFLWATHDADGASAAVHGVPFVSQAMSDTVMSDFGAHGVWALCRGPMSGIPYKLYAVIAPAYCGLLSFVLVSIPARLERLLVSWAVFAVAGRLFHGPFQRRPSMAVGIHGAYWALVYAYYWQVI